MTPQVQSLHDDSRRLLLSALNESLLFLWRLTHPPRRNPSLVLKSPCTLAEPCVLTYFLRCSNPSLQRSVKGSQLQSLKDDSRRFLLSALNESLFALWTLTHCPRLNPSLVLKVAGTLAEPFSFTYCLSCSNPLFHWSVKGSQLQSLHDDSRSFLRSSLNESLLFLWRRSTK